ncbi:MAG: nitroreductase family protein [Nanoarchaeota archaeon]|nr:nitroreductase family protein [Nanoarchaeota archaeon]|tara:strand:+ start:128 stop:751 length:624 start_codon:yes stop_codon:yes gene_type:complete
MQDILKLIKSRRNVKDFTPQFVDWDSISKIIDAGRHAPSAGNVQNWKFVVVNDIGKKQQIAEACLQQYEITKAAAHIVILGETEKMTRYYGSRGELYTIQGCAAAAQNMMIEAQSLGLATGWVGAFDESHMQKILGVPNDVSVQVVITVGHAAKNPSKPPKYPLETLIYFNKWRAKIRNPTKYFREYSLMIRKKVEQGKDLLKKIKP